jgi:8-oxo-dGTP diphosphatase
MIDVTCAIIEYDNKVLITQRSEKMHLSLKWEFPGGKVNKNEKTEDSIIREIKEELCIDVHPLFLLPESIYDYGDKIIKLIPFICKYNSGELILKEHKDAVWTLPEHLTKYDWCEADIPIVNSYLKHINIIGQ